MYNRCQVASWAKEHGKGDQQSRVRKGKRILAYAGPPVSWAVLKVMLTSGSIWMKGLHDLFNTRPCSLSQYQVSPHWCSGPRNRVEVKIWCPEVEDGAPHWTYVLLLLTDLAMRGGCASGALSWDIVRNVVYVKILLSQVVLHMLTETWYLPREQVDKRNVLPSQHPVGVVEGCIDAGQVRDSSWILQGRLQSLHLRWGSHRGEEILYTVLQFWHLAVQ